MPSGTSLDTVFKLSTRSRWCSRNSRAMSPLTLLGAVTMQPSTPTKGLDGWPGTTAGTGATVKRMLYFTRVVPRPGAADHHGHFTAGKVASISA